MLILRIAVALVLAVALAAVRAPASRQSPAIATGVRIGTVAVGGLTSEPARAAVEAAFGRPLQLDVGSRTWTVDPAVFEVRAAVDDAVSAALTAPEGTRVQVRATSSRATVRRFVTKLAQEVDTRARNARLVGFAARPVIRPERPGIELERAAAVETIEAALAAATGEPVPLPTRTLAPARTRERFGPLVVIDRGANLLRLYRGTKLVRRIGVATGAPSYPTPSGIFRVVDKQRDPWWYPPDSPWAAGAKPVPPGPGNPLGTRWMGISAPAVGMHGTPDAASIGYSASHGCIRMRIADAEWLFERVSLGTPVLIL